jgi:4-methyl-5(b-hydroxyethyl)-thiazole monophosphate biosynthesis
MKDEAVLVPLMEGFEEIEAVTIIDVLRRANLEVIVAGKRRGPVQGSHGIEVMATHALGEVRSGNLVAVVLPGGMPGAKNLAADPATQALIKQVAADGKLVAAICAAPMALASAGVHTGHKVTSYPGFEKYLDGATYVQDRVVVDGMVVTSRGPGTALEFAIALAGLLSGKEIAEDLRRKMLVG